MAGLGIKGNLDMNTPILYNLTGWDLTLIGLAIGFVIYVIKWLR